MIILVVVTTASLLTGAAIESDVQLCGSLGCRAAASLTAAASRLTLNARAVLRDRTQQMLHAASGLHSASAFRTASTMRVSSQSLEAPSMDPPKKFDLVVFSTREMRLLFRKMVSDFQPPVEIEHSWNKTTRYIWNSFKEYMFGEYVMDEEKGYGLMAMNGGTPCVAAFYSDAFINDFDSIDLDMQIRNMGDNCKGGGAAVLCQLIRSSSNTNGEWSPLRVMATANERSLISYYESFGCEMFWEDHFDDEDMQVVLNHQNLICRDPTPPKCEHLESNVVAAEDYFFSVDSESLEADLRAIAARKITTTELPLVRSTTSTAYRESLEIEAASRKVQNIQHAADALRTAGVEGPALDGLLLELKKAMRELRSAERATPLPIPITTSRLPPPKLVAQTRNEEVLQQLEDMWDNLGGVDRRQRGSGDVTLPPMDINFVPPPMLIAQTSRDSIVTHSAALVAVLAGAGIICSGLHLRGDTPTWVEEPFMSI